MTEELSLLLTWRHGRGGLAPFFSALEQGRILGACCPACGQTVAPPRARRAIDGAQMKPVDPPPTGIARQVTTGSANSLLGAGSDEPTFALIQVTGSDNCILARIAATDAPVALGAKVRLARVVGATNHPVQLLVFQADA